MSNINPLVNFDRAQQEHNIDTALQQALRNYDPHVQHLSPQRATGSASQKEQQRNLMGHVPIDPSIGDGSDKDSTNDFARSTAQAAVQSSQKMQQAGAHMGGERPKSTKPRVNKPGQKFGAKKKSWVWNWFTQDPNDCNVATCEFCGKVIKRLNSDKGSPKKLGEHLKTHKIDKMSVNPKRDGNAIQLPNDSSRHFFNTLNATQPSFKAPSVNQNQSSSQSQFPVRQEDSPAVNQPTYDRSEFDQSGYSHSKFQKDIMKFLVENKLHLAIVKSPSFRQVVYTLKPEAIPDLNELNHLYSSLLEVIHNEKPLTEEDVQNVEQSANAEVSQEHNRTDDANVDDSLTAASAAGWV